MIPNYCQACGTGYGPEQLVAPFATEDESLTCRRCDYKVWDSVRAVPVCVQPIIDPQTGVLGLAIAKRAIRPALGEWCLLAGNMKNNGESIEEAAIREWTEETGIEPGLLVGITKTYGIGHNQVLVAVEFDPITTAAWKQARLCKENSEFGIWYEDSPFKLGFPIHQEMAVYWSNGA